MKVAAASHRHFGIPTTLAGVRGVPKVGDGGRCSTVMSTRVLAILLLALCSAACRKDAAFGPEDEAAILAVMHAQQEA